LENLRKKTEEGLASHNELLRLISLFDEQRKGQEKILENRTRNLEYLDGKSEEYKETLQKLQVFIYN
jgi:hypothetical protein